MPGDLAQAMLDTVDAGARTPGGLAQAMPDMVVAGTAKPARLKMLTAADLARAKLGEGNAGRGRGQDGAARMPAVMLAGPGCEDVGGEDDTRPLTCLPVAGEAGCGEAGRGGAGYCKAGQGKAGESEVAYGEAGNGVYRQGEAGCSGS
jgi:hypothetical protein